MFDQSCESLRRWLRQAQGEIPTAAPTAQLADHVAGCARCRGLLFGLASELPGAAPPSAPINCAACQSGLDAYIDAERHESAAAALQRFPEIWWHLWSCADCAELHHLTHALLSAQDQGVLTPVPAPAQAPRMPQRLPLIQLARAFLHNVFAEQAALGLAWSGGGDEAVFAEEQLNEYHIAIVVRQRGGVYWGIGVTITPPLAGWVLIAFGERRFRAAFDQRGQALLTSIPLVLLADRDGPNLVMTIEPAEESG